MEESGRRTDLKDEICNNVDIIKGKEIDNTSDCHSGKDSGWAWIIVFGTAMHTFLLVGFEKSFGLFLVQFLTVYNTNSSMMSIILGLQKIVVSISSLFVLNIGSRIFGNRKLIIVGAVISSLGYLLTAFAPSVAFIILSQSVMYGFGCACTSGPIFLVLNSYFDKRLGFAYSVANVGGSIGSLVMPIIIQNLLEEYGLQGALLVTSGLILNTAIVGSLMRPFPSKESTLDPVKTEEEPLVDEFDHFDSTNRYKNKFSLSESHIGKFTESIITKDLKLDDQSLCLSQTRHNNYRERSFSERDKDSESSNMRNRPYNSIKALAKGVSGNAINIYGIMQSPETICSMLSLNVIQYFGTQQEEKPSEVTGQYKGVTDQYKHCCHSNIVHFNILNNYRLKSILFAAFCSFPGCVYTIVYLPAFATDNDISNDRTAILLTITGVCDLVARFSFAWITDSKRIKRCYILGTALGVTGMATMFNPFYRTFGTFLVYTVIYGLFGNVYFCLLTILIREIVGIDKLPAALSLQILIHGVSSIVFAPLLGYIRDHTGSYMISFYVMGAGLIIGSVVMYCQPLVTKLEDRRTKIHSDEISVTINKP